MGDMSTSLRNVFFFWFFFHVFNLYAHRVSGHNALYSAWTQLYNVCVDEALYPLWASLLLPKFEIFIEPLRFHRTPIHHCGIFSLIAPSINMPSSLLHDLRWGALSWMVANSSSQFLLTFLVWHLTHSQLHLLFCFFCPLCFVLFTLCFSLYLCCLF